MSTAELKTDLYQLIEEINDTKVLKAIQAILKKSIEDAIGGNMANKKNITKKASIKLIEKKNPIDEVFGIWKNEDISLEKIREKAWRHNK
ncbi:MAG: hypothetical protein ACLQQ4_05700 [Bacteroidia bacterium]